MASSSSLPVKIPQTEHDVFVSFRGEDTRNNFTSHLVAALRGKQIETFNDYQLIKGDEISPSLVTAIEGSDISVVVFSKQYANSRWCLDELAKIWECKNKYGQIVIPVFYHVDPSHVRKQTGIYKMPFSELAKRFQDKESKWRTALTETANLSGFHLQANRPESEFIEEIVNNILKRLSDKGGSHDIGHLIGVKPIIMKLESLLSTASKRVYTLSIWGIGGIGKTTIADAIFRKISNRFEGSYFVKNVRENEEKIGLDQLRRQLFSTLLGGDIDPNNDFSFKRLKRKKVVVVFDDVTRFEQIEHLIGSLHSFGAGSRIIITTRDRQVLNNVNGIYEMKGLLHNDAFMLFSQHGFGQSHPNVGFENLSKQIVEYAHGVPLVLKVLGRLLFGKEKEMWESAIKKLKKIPNLDIQKVLKISYDGLDDHEQDIFLDIVCFYKGWKKDDTIELLDACGFSTEIGIKVLEEKCLIIISNNMITMHDLMEEMGKEIIRQESIDDPGKRSRLWDHEDIYKVLTYNTGTQVIKGISFNMSKVKETCFKLRTFKKMHKLRFLEFYGKNKCKVSEYQGPIFFELRHLCWDGYPLESLPLHLHPKYLLSIELRGSKIKTLWDGNQDLCNAKHIDLSFSLQLKKIPDLKNTQNLESLILKGCSSLVEIDPTTQLNKLVIMDLRECQSLKSFPPRIHSKSLKYLFLSGCTSLMRLPDLSSCNIEALNIHRLTIEELPSSIQCLSKLVRLNISECPRLKKIPSLGELSSLKNLSISNCSNLQRLPNALGNLKALRQLEVDRTTIGKVPSSIGFLHSLNFLKVSGCRITELPESLGELSSLEDLSISDCSNLQRLPNALGNLKALRRLEFDGTDIGKVPSSIGFLHSLNFLKLSGCRITELPESLGELSSLEEFYISDCSNLQRLPNALGNLKALCELKVDRTAIGKVPSSIGFLHSLNSLKLSGCCITELPESLEELSSLYYLSIFDCSNFQRLPNALGNLKALRRLEVDGTAIGKVPSSIGFLHSLNFLKLSGCRITELPESLGELSLLEELSISDCSNLRRLPNALGNLKALCELKVDRTAIEKVPSSIGFLHRLDSLQLSGCRITELPESLGELSSLKELYISDCSSLQRLPNALGNLKALCALKVDGTAIGKVPSSIGFLHSLNSLKLSGCRIMELPESLEELSSLCNLSISDCLNLQRLPNTLGNLKALRRLEVDGTAIEKVPSFIGFLHSLNFLKLSGCRITELPESLGELSSLEELYISDCSNLQRLPNALGNLKALCELKVDRTAIEKVPPSIGFLHSLMFLDLSGCHVTDLPESLGQLSLLHELKLSYCERLRSLTKLPYSIESICAYSCESLEELPSDFSIFLANVVKWSGFSVVDLRDCFRLDPNELSKIVKEFLQNIQIIVNEKWEENEFRQPLPGGVIYYPGSEIPEWFEFQGMGSSGTLKLPQGWRNNKLLGIVLCVIGTFADDKYSGYEDNLYKLWCCCEFVTKDGQLRSIYWDAGIPCYVDSDHVILRYGLHRDIILKDFDECRYNDKVFIQFYRRSSFLDLSETVEKEVKKWGIHFLYRQDCSIDEEERTDEDEEEEGANEQESNIEAENTDKGEEQSSGDDDEEGDNEEESSREAEEPHPKRLKYSTSSF